MEKKPVVTCYGDQSLFYNLAGRVVQNLPKEPIDWKRSYGRPPKTVHVEAQFVFLEESFLESAIELALTEQPFFHIFWVEICELDRYKSSVRDDIANWISLLRKYNAEQEWMVVVVSGSGTQEAKTPNRKLNPLRTSIDDKIRSDFCPKHPERVTNLLDPSKHDRGSDQSWQTFMDRLRCQLMNAFNHHVSLFEDHMRTQRERRTESSWNFLDYFLLQEELAFAYEMMGLYEDALIQYDELDALFSQFVLNSGAGATSGLEWLADFAAKTVTSWDGLCLSFPINQKKREMLKYRSATLLDFRNYVFSRQCSLLLLLCRPWEVAKRSLPFMHQTINELKILEVSLTDGAEACWVFLSCLEVLHTCEKYSDSSEIENYSLHTANLWAYAREKLLILGDRLCGLMPDTETTSDQLQRVVELVAGMGDHLYDVPGRPMAKLREALSSKAAFQKLYMEVAELAMGTYKHIGRIRSARVIGRDLARFYMKLGEYHKAESFFLDLLRMYQTQRWDRLTIAICKEMALCYQATGETHKYFKILTELAASGFCDLEMRKFYQKELSDCARSLESSFANGLDESNSRPNSRTNSTSEMRLPNSRPASMSSDTPERTDDDEMETPTRVAFLPVFEAKALGLSDGATSPGDAQDDAPPMELAPGEDVTVALRLLSNLPQQLLPTSLTLTIRRLPHQGVNGAPCPGDAWPDDASPHVFHFPPALANPLAAWEGERLQMVSRLDLGQPGPRRSIVAAYVACRNPAATLKKLDSVYQLIKNRQTPEDADEVAAETMELKNPRIYPGSNLLYLKTTIPNGLEPGFYGFHRLNLSLDGVKFVETVPDFAGLRFRLLAEARRQLARVRLQLPSDRLVERTFPAGRAASFKAAFLHLSDAIATRVAVPKDSRFDSDAPLSVDVFDSRGCRVFAPGEKDSFLIRDISDPYAPYIKDLVVVGHHDLAEGDVDPRTGRIVFRCSWLSDPVEEVVSFRPALRARHAVHVVPGDEESRLVQIVVALADARSRARYRLKDPLLSRAIDSDQGSNFRQDVVLDIVALNRSDSQPTIDCDIEASFVWDLRQSLADVGETEIIDVENVAPLTFNAFVDSLSDENDAQVEDERLESGGLLSVPLSYSFTLQIPFKH